MPLAIPVTAAKSGPHTIAVRLTGTDAALLYARARSDVVAMAYGSGVNHGKLVLRRARRDDDSVIPIFCTADGGIGFNLRLPSLPGDLAMPRDIIVLPHEWHGDDLLLDLSPLKKPTAAP